MTVSPTDSRVVADVTKPQLTEFTAGGRFEYPLLRLPIHLVSLSHYYTITKDCEKNVPVADFADRLLTSHGSLLAGLETRREQLQGVDFDGSLG